MENRFASIWRYFRAGDPGFELTETVFNLHNRRTACTEQIYVQDSGQNNWTKIKRDHYKVEKEKRAENAQLSAKQITKTYATPRLKIIQKLDVDFVPGE